MNPQEPVQASVPEPVVTPVAQPTPSVPAQEPVKIGKFKASRMLVRESLNVLRQDKELAWFPVLSAITSLVALIGFIAVLFFVIMGGDIHMFSNGSNEQMSVAGYAAVFVYYILTFTITNYFLAGVYTIVHARFNGTDLAFSDGIANANKHFGRIFSWSVISATVGIILQIISDKSKLIGKIVAAIFGAAWGILTYFSLPSLVIGQRSIGDSFKESAAVIRKTWGETIIVNFGIGLFFWLITFLVIAVMIGIAVLVPAFEMLVLLGILFVIYIIALSIITSTLGSIVKLALYEYAATGVVPQGFTPELIKGAVKAGK
ncbi:MAG: hypothetical protein RLY57_411 [Candidatus Parcubacteria bacterium]|jgi:hypothetical protein